MGLGMGSSKSSKSKRNIVVCCVLLMGLLLGAEAQGDWCTSKCIGEGYQYRSSAWMNCYLNCKYPGGGGAPRDGLSTAEVSAGEAGGAMAAKGGRHAVRFSVCDVWCEDVHPNMNHRLCVQNLCPYDKTPRDKLTSGDLLFA